MASHCCCSEHLIKDGLQGKLWDSNQELCRGDQDGVLLVYLLILVEFIIFRSLLTTAV